MIKKLFIRALGIILSCLLVAGCWMKRNYFEPTAENVTVEVLTAEGHIPQAGTLLKIDLDYQVTKTSKPDPYSKIYRCRVWVDDVIYAQFYSGWQYAVVEHVPIISNDSHQVKKIVVEGSVSKSYDTLSDWEDWHQLYSNIQDCLPSEKELEYSNLSGKQLLISISNGVKLHYSFADNYSAEAFKRYLAKKEYTTEMHFSNDNAYSRNDSNLITIIPPCGHPKERSTSLYFLPPNGFAIGGYDNGNLTLIGMPKEESERKLTSLFTKNDYTVVFSLE